MRLPKPTKSCSDFLYEAERSIYTLRAPTGQSRDSFWLPVKRGSAESAMIGVESTYITQPCFQDDLGVVRPKFQAGLMDRACISPIRLTDASASSRAFFNDSALRLVDCNGSNGGP